MKAPEPLITTSPERLSGTPVFAGTRVPVQTLIDYLEGGLPVWQKYLCWLLVKMCRDCAHFVRQYQRTIALEQSAFDSVDDPVRGWVPEELVNAALARRRRKS